VGCGAGNERKEGIGVWDHRMYGGHSSIDEVEVLYQAVGSIGLF
jgi:hypothetical protein